MISSSVWNAKATARYDSLHYHDQDTTKGLLLRTRLYHLQDLAANGVVVFKWSRTGSYPEGWPPH